MKAFRSATAPWIAVLFLSLAWPAAAAPGPGDPAAVSAWLGTLGPRREGSPAEDQVFTALRGWFSSRAAVQEAAFDREEGEHSFSRRLWFRIAGTLPGELVVAVPTDGANHRGLSWAAAWADRALTSGTPVSLTFLFTGAERGPGASRGLGSRSFLGDFYPVVPAAVLYLDTAPGEDAVVLTTESGSSPSPLWMVQGLTVALAQEELPPRFTGTAPSLFRLDLPEKRNALGPWFDRSVPGLLVTSGPDGLAPVRALAAFAGALDQGVPAFWDRHYLAFDFGSWKFFWGQRTYILVLLGVSAFLLFGYSTLGRTRRGSLRVLGSGLWQLPVLLAFGFLALSAATALTWALMEARGDPEFWTRVPLVAGGFKAVTAISLYLVLFLPFRRSPLSKNPDFYGQAALVSLGLMTLAAAAFELSFSFYFLWALVWAAVQLTLPWRPVKLAALVLGPLWLFKAAYDVLGPQPDLELSRWILASPLAGNFLLAVLFFPFLLQVNAWHFSGHRHQDRNDALWAGIQVSAWVLATFTLGFLVLRYTPDLPAPNPEVVQRYDMTVRPVPSAKALWQTKTDRSAFLDRTVWNLRFTGPLPADSLTLTLVSDDPILVYDCSFPVVLDPEGHRVRIIVGRQPPLPLSLRLTLPQGTQARLEVEVVLEGDRRYEITDAVELGP